MCPSWTTNAGHPGYTNPADQRGLRARNRLTDVRGSRHRSPDSRGRPWMRRTARSERSSSGGGSAGSCDDARGRARPDKAGSIGMSRGGEEGSGMRIRNKMLLAMSVPIGLLIVQVLAVNYFVRELQIAVSFIGSAHAAIEADFVAAGARRQAADRRSGSCRREQWSSQEGPKPTARRGRHSGTGWSRAIGQVNERERRPEDRSAAALRALERRPRSGSRGLRPGGGPRR